MYTIYIVSILLDYGKMNNEYIPDFTNINILKLKILIFL